jgi:hypothetical protein
MDGLRSVVLLTSPPVLLAAAARAQRRGGRDCRLIGHRRVGGAHAAPTAADRLASQVAVGRRRRGGQESVVASGALIAPAGRAMTSC